MVKAYPKYKDSGVPWLGEVPEHWALKRTKRLLRERVQKGFPDEPLLAATQTKGVVRKEQYENRTVLALKDLHLLKLVRVGDFVISLRSFQGGIEYAHEQGIISPAYTVLYPIQPEMHGFLAWLFKSRPYIDNLKLHVTGIRQGQNIDYEKLGRSEISIPSYQEQSAIVGFLDNVNLQIRRYIWAKQHVIKLLNEEKQAIINKAVTRGINPNVRLKPSGVDWLGEVPEHWNVKKLRRVCSIVRTGNTPSGADEKYYSIDGFNWYTPGDFKQKIYLETSERQLSQLGVESVRLFPKGTVMMIGIGATIGKVSVTTVEASCNQQINAMVVNEEMQKEYFAYYLRSLKDYIVMCGKYTTLPIINQDETKSLPVLVPPKTEQKAIVDYIESETRSLETSISIEEHSIELIREYRMRLISDVVTGKTDVRDIKLTSIAEVDDQIPIDEQEVSEDIEDSEEVVNADE